MFLHFEQIGGMKFNKGCCANNYLWSKEKLCWHQIPLFNDIYLLSFLQCLINYELNFTINQYFRDPRQTWREIRSSGWSGK